MHNPWAGGRGYESDLYNYDKPTSKYRNSFDKTKLEFRKVNRKYTKVWDDVHVNEAEFTFSNYTLDELFTQFTLFAEQNYYQIDHICCWKFDPLTGMGCKNQALTNSKRIFKRCWCQYILDMIEKGEAMTKFILADEDGNTCAMIIKGYFSGKTNNTKLETTHVERITNYNTYNTFMSATFSIRDRDDTTDNIHLTFVDLNDQLWKYTSNKKYFSLWTGSVYIKSPKVSLPKRLQVRYKGAKFVLDERLCCMKQNNNSVAYKTECLFGYNCWCGLLNFLRAGMACNQRITLRPHAKCHIRENAYMYVHLDKDKEDTNLISMKFRFEIPEKIFGFKGFYKDDTSSSDDDFGEVHHYYDLFEKD